MTDGEADALTSDNPVGQTVGHYEVLAEIGRGGMGVVYRGRDLILGRDVALKVPGRGRASESDRRRFLQEARAAARMRHPNIVPVFEVFEHQGRPWLVMELIDGRTLRARLVAGRLTLEETLAYAEQVASALHAAHSAGILHRDINPNNILIRSDGRACLTDFGLATYFSAAHDLSAVSTQSVQLPGKVVGTLGYIAPEQILGHEPTPAADVFSLGAVLFEMCTGGRAFPGANQHEIVEATLNLQPPSLRELVPAASAELDSVVRRTLAKTPDSANTTRSGI